MLVQVLVQLYMNRFVPVIGQATSAVKLVTAAAAAKGVSILLIQSAILQNY
eukprot:COSAG05_NODE_26436_length_188_cov_30.853933_1_plen_50_part_01